ncbi:metal ABC transporter solute-binding protein, Zn/Mn family [Streptomyces sp. NPDC053048]|uniref:metal ABC transporter solute-binding protein, Zn/Mn family n=1 Tax=Streptomyces sp. NPDC053048 TaxID=3365694 RepID=UPI0037D4C3A5
MRISSARGPALLALLALLALVPLTGCGGGPGSGDGTTSPGPASAVRVVASTSVYGDIVRQVGGDRVDVTSVITDPAQDPHSFEAGTRHQLALSRARVVVENGGGYDDFIGRMLRSSGNSSAVVVNAVEVAGRTAPAGGELNEHVWYDLPTAGRLATRVADALAGAAPANAGYYRRNAEEFNGRLRPLEAEEARIKADHPGAAVAVTEPVPRYLIEACGLRDRTPAEFGAAVEEGNEVSAAVLRQTLGLFTGRQVEALVVNQQTSGPQTEKVRRAAEENGIPVVPVTETLPRGQDYIGWMRSVIDALRKALDA